MQLVGHCHGNRSPRSGYREEVGGSVWGKMTPLRVGKGRRGGADASPLPRTGRGETLITDSEARVGPGLEPGPGMIIHCHLHLYNLQPGPEER